MYSSSCEGRGGGREGGGEGVEKGRGAGGRKKEMEEREREGSGDVDRQQKVVSHTVKFIPSFSWWTSRSSMPCSAHTMIPAHPGRQV